jgi:hypothetical protein
LNNISTEILKLIIELPHIIDDLGISIYTKLSNVSQIDFLTLTKDDCIEFVKDIIFNKVYYGFQREKSVINDNLALKFPEIKFEESLVDLNFACDIDYLGWVGDNAFGIQIKPVTSKANFEIFHHQKE